MGWPKRHDFVVTGLVAGSFMAIYFVMMQLEPFVRDMKKDYWLVGLIFNLIGYSAIFVPGLLALRYVKRHHINESQQGYVAPLIKVCFYGSGDDSINDSIVESKQQADAENQPEWKVALRLLGCFFGLQVSYLTWGLLQEKIMTRQYVDSTGQVGQFKDSQFLVFVNRIMAFAVALLYVTAVRMPRHRTPLYKYAYCSFSNIMSSWCQYEALKFISFPTQVLAKASKIIPVMFMGWVVSRRRYERYEYVVAVLISIGMVLFLSGNADTTSRDSNATTTTVSGLLLLLGYMGSDAFTSNWQKELFNTYKMAPVQAMCGVNLFSCLLTAVSLLQQGAFFDSLVFMSQFPAFTFDCVVLSFCSAFGQLIIYYTISQFGAVVFTIIMTLRQALAVLLSCFVYSHPIAPIGALGITIVFSAVFLKIYVEYRLRKAKQAAKIASTKIDDIAKPTPRA